MKKAYRIRSMRKLSVLLGVTLLGSLFLLSNISRRTYEDGKATLFTSDTFKGCKRKTKVGFLKTHKCASSSLQNILLRFARKNDLNVVLPSSGNYLGKHRKYSRSMLMNTPWERANLTYDVFCLHTIWNQAEVEATLGSGAVYVTMLRDPVDLFESLWSYVGLHKFYHTDLETFAMAEKTGLLSQRAYKNLGRNQMLWDLGMPASQMDNHTAVEEMIRQVEAQFDLVLISERFQESMILMKHELCWDYRDVVNLKLNAREKENKSRLSSAARKALEEYLWADYALYNHFKAIFTQKLNQFGEKAMSHELEILSQANANMKDICNLKETKNALLSGEKKLYGKNVVGYSGSSDSEQCRMLAMSENSFLDAMRIVQRERALLKYKQDDADHSNQIFESVDLFEEHLKTIDFVDVPKTINVEKLKKILNPGHHL